MKTAIGLAIKHAKERKQFQTTLTEFGMIQDKIAHMAAKCYATESMVYFSTGKMVNGLKDYSLESAACKIYGSENLWSVVDMAMQIAAGTGYMKEYPYELLMRDSRINMIFEGTNEILRCFLALSGIKGPSEDLKELGKIADVSAALNNPIKSLGVLTNFAKRRIGKMIPSKTLANFHPKLEEHAQNFSSMLSGFAIQVENTLIKYGKNIIHHELPQMRLANMSLELYAILAVLSRTTYILNQPEVDDKQKDYVLSMTNIICEDARKKFISNLKAMGHNTDKDVKRTCEHIDRLDGYGLDILDY
jgi:acyl-CoA dehydrogenase family protein 9